jgi:DNA-binding beta-propeller fold protein YncE
MKGAVTTFSGQGNPGFDDGPSYSAKFSSPTGIAVDFAGNVYVADSKNHRVRKISPQGNLG